MSKILLFILLMVAFDEENGLGSFEYDPGFLPSGIVDRNHRAGFVYGLQVSQPTVFS